MFASSVQNTLEPWWPDAPYAAVFFGAGFQAGGCWWLSRRHPRRLRKGGGDGLASGGRRGQHTVLRNRARSSTNTHEHTPHARTHACARARMFAQTHNRTREYARTCTHSIHTCGRTRVSTNARTRTHLVCHLRAHAVRRHDARSTPRREVKGCASHPPRNISPSLTRLHPPLPPCAPGRPGAQ